MYLPQIAEPISYGRTKDRYITQEIGYLSFPNAAIVTVLVKQAAVDGAGQEMWLAEVSILHVLLKICFPCVCGKDAQYKGGNTCEFIS